MNTKLGTTIRMRSILIQLHCAFCKQKQEFQHINCSFGNLSELRIMHYKRNLYTQYEFLFVRSKRGKQITHTRYSQRFEVKQGFCCNNILYKTPIIPWKYDLVATFLEMWVVAHACFWVPSQINYHHHHTQFQHNTTKDITVIAATIFRKSNIYLR